MTMRPTLGLKLALTIGLVLCLGFAAYALMQYALGAARDAAHEVTNVNGPRLQAIIEMEGGLNESAAALRYYKAHNNNQALELLRSSHKTFAQRLDHYATLADGSGLAGSLDQLDALYGELRALDERLMQLIDQRQSLAPTIVETLDQVHREALESAYTRKQRLPPEVIDSRSLDALDKRIRQLEMQVEAYLDGNSASGGPALARSLSEMKQVFHQYDLFRYAHVDKAGVSTLTETFGRLQSVLGQRLATDTELYSLERDRDELRDDLDDILDQQRVVARARLGEANALLADQIDRSRQIVVGLMAAAAVTGVILGLLIVRGVVRPLRQLSMAAAAVGAGDFEQRVAIRSDDELGDLGRAFNRMTDELARTTVSRQYVAGITHAMGEALFVLTTDFEIEHVNPTACSMLGLSEQDLRRRSFIGVLASGGETAALLRSMLESGKDREGELIAADGHSIPVIMTMRPMPAGADRARSLVCTAMDITDLKRVEVELLRSRDEIRELYRELQSTEEAEKRRVAGELHDELGALQTLIKSRLFRLGERPEIASHPVATRGLEELHGLVDSASAALDRIVGGLHPSMLEHFGIAAAAEWYVSEIQKHCLISCEIEVHGSPQNIDAGRALALYRALQEAVTNATRHANATAIRLDLAFSEERIRLTVSDNGVGCTPDTLDNSRRTGIRRMRERIEAYDGVVAVTTAPGKGLKLTINLPSDTSRESAEGPVGNTDQVARLASPPVGRTLIDIADEV